MEENNLNRERESENIDIKVLVEKFITRWRWFAVSVPLCLPEPSAYLQRDG